MKRDKKPTILIIDNDQNVQRSLRSWFKIEGFKPFIASNGKEAIRMVQNEWIDVIILDIKLKKEDGISLSRRLMEVDSKFKIIILTDNPTYKTAVKAMKIGVFDYLSKDLSNEKILNVIRRAVEDRDRERLTTKENEFSPENRLKLILFCNHSLIKERLQNYSKNNPGFKLASTFSGVNSFKINQISEEIDIALVCASCILKSFDNSYSVFPDLYRGFPAIKPVVINESFTDIEKVELLKLGVRGFSAKDLSCEKLAMELSRVKKGEILVSQKVKTLSLQDMSKCSPINYSNEKELSGLTEREFEILRTMVLGLKNREIAEKLFISDKTVKTHISSIYKKLVVDSRAKAILMAIEKKLV
jgi:DNA-binding NarL/FixJ family response regulator